MMFAELPLEEQGRLVEKAEKLIAEGINWTDFVKELDVEKDVAKDIILFIKRTNGTNIEAKIFRK